MWRPSSFVMLVINGEGIFPVGGRPPRKESVQRLQKKHVRVDEDHVLEARVTRCLKPVEPRRRSLGQGGNAENPFNHVLQLISSCFLLLTSPGSFVLQQQLVLLLQYGKLCGVAVHPFLASAHSVARTSAALSRPT